MKPPLSNDATPVPDVPPRPTAIAISRTLMLMSYNRFTAMPAASAACVPVPRPTCEKILFDADADAAAIQEDRARALAHPARQFRVACDGDLIHPFCHFCRDADAGLSDRQPDPAIHPIDALRSIKVIWRREGVVISIVMGCPLASMVKMFMAP